MMAPSGNHSNSLPSILSAVKVLGEIVKHARTNDATLPHHRKESQMTTVVIEIH